MSLRADAPSSTNILVGELLARGTKAFEQMCRDGREESLHLEFKTLSDCTGLKLGPHDKRTIAKSISGFCNSEGGLLILGVETETVEGLDRAVATRPIANLRSFANRLAAWLPESISPTHPGIGIYAVPLDQPDEGVLLIEVPPSSRRPHMSLAPDHQRYFRRGSQGTVPMYHGEVRDLMLAERDATLAVEWRCPLSGTTSGSFGKSCDVDLIFSLKNIGHVAARSPFLIVKAHSWRTRIATNSPSFRQRRKADGRDAIYLLETIQAEDDLDVAHYRMAVWLNNSGLTEAETDFLESAVARQDDEAFAIAAERDTSRRPVFGGHGTRVLRFTLSFGAENAARVEQELEMNGFELLRLALANDSSR